MPLAYRCMPHIRSDERFPSLLDHEKEMTYRWVPVPAQNEDPVPSEYAALAQPRSADVF
jgi:hypothetical protein